MSCEQDYLLLREVAKVELFNLTTRIYNEAALRGFGFNVPLDARDQFISFLAERQHMLSSFFQVAVIEVNGFLGLSRDEMLQDSILLYCKGQIRNTI